MTNEEYNTICNQIITATMQYIHTKNIKRYNTDMMPQIENDNAIYKTAITSKAPVTLVYTPSGTDRTKLIQDRLAVLKANGADLSKIMLLSMNIAKAEQMKKEIPDVINMTFSEFTDGLVKLNHPELEDSDMESIANLMRISFNDELSTKFIETMSISNPRDKATLLTCFVNNNIDEVINRLRKIKKSEHTLNSLIAQNKMYFMNKTPYNIESIIINGVQNVPVHTLCAIIKYSFINKCNLFMTGLPNESIYDFNMSYKNSMDTISAYSKIGIDIIRLEGARIEKAITDLIDLKPMAVIPKDIVNYSVINTNYDAPPEEPIYKAIEQHYPYIENLIDQKEKLVILAKSKKELGYAKDKLTKMLKEHGKSAIISDVTGCQCPTTTYGIVASKNYKRIANKYPNLITVQQFFYELYELLTEKIANEENKYEKLRYSDDRENITAFVEENMDTFVDYNASYNVLQIIYMLINIEETQRKHNEEVIKQSMMIDISDSDIVLSTIHACVDTKRDHALILMKNNTENINETLYRVALSRASKTERICFINYGTFTTTYQKYLQIHST